MRPFPLTKITARAALALLAATSFGSFALTRIARADEPPASALTVGGEPGAQGTQPAPPATQCPAGWIEPTYARIRPSTVRIESAGAIGAGFVFSTPRRVATAYHVVDLGRPIYLYAVDQRKLSARVVGIDSKHDLAMLEADEDIGPPLPAGRPGAIGDPVLAIGHTPVDFAFIKYLGVADWSLSAGILSGYTDEKMQSDAKVELGHTGGPLVNCAGEVIAVSSKRDEGKGITFFIPVALLEKLAARAPEPYHGVWRLRDPTLGSFLQGAGREFTIGAYVGLSLVAYDRLQLTLRLGYGGAFYTQLDGNAVSRSVYRGLAHLLVGWRFIASSRYGLYLLPAVGVTLTLDHDSERLVSYDAVHATVVASDATSTTFYASPALALSLLIGRHAEIGLTWEVRTSDFADSHYTLVAALHF